MDHFDQDLEPYFTSLGFMAHSYAMMEHGLTVAMTAIHHFHGGRDIDKNLPRTALNAKLRYLRNVLDRVAFSDPSNAEALAFLVKVEALATERQLHIHGTPQEIKDGTVELVKMDINKADNLLHQTYQFVTIQRMLQIGDEATNLASFALDWAVKMVPENSHSLLRNPRPKLAD